MTGVCINELDVDKRPESTRICVNYVFEYFNNYLNTHAADEKTVLHEAKVDKFRGVIRNYSEEVQEWLVPFYSDHGKFMNRNLGNMIDDTYFLLYDTDAEFRSLSYEIFPKASKKFPFLKPHSEQIYLFLKDHHRVLNLFSPYSSFNICESIDEWINDTYQRHGVNLFNFGMEWVSHYYESSDTWPATHKKKSEYYEKYKNGNDKISKSLIWEYDYKQKSNLFNLDALYRAMPKKSFTKGRKQHFETLLLYCWLSHVEGDAEYWQEYLTAVLPSLYYKRQLFLSMLFAFA